MRQSVIALSAVVCCLSAGGCQFAGDDPNVIAGLRTSIEPEAIDSAANAKLAQAVSTVTVTKGNDCSAYWCRTVFGPGPIVRVTLKTPGPDGGMVWHGVGRDPGGNLFFKSMGPAVQKALLNWGVFSTSGRYDIDLQITSIDGPIWAGDMWAETSAVCVVTQGASNSLVLQETFHSKAAASPDDPFILDGSVRFSVVLDRSIVKNLAGCLSRLAQVRNG
jgi:hypothetical protein